MDLRWIGTRAACGLLLATLLTASAGGSDGEPTPALEPAEAALAELRAEPAAFVGRTVRFTLQLDRELDAWQPFLTRFGPGDFAAYRAWPDEAFLWERKAFDDTTSRVFARRGTAPELVLGGGRSYDRFAVTAVVRDVFLGEPWLEVTDARRLTEAVGEGAILHASRGLELFAQGNRELARDQLERARAGMLPEHARAELDRLIERCD